MFPDHLLKQAEDILAICRERSVMLSTAESCTGGLISGLFTEIAGSSAVIDRGFVTYSNAAKSELLGVSPELLARHGSVSRETALAMADGALARSNAHLAVAVTGVAGPGGGSALKPVGLVHFALARTGAATRHMERRFGDMGRGPVRMATVEAAVDMLAKALESQDK